MSTTKIRPNSKDTSFIQVNVLSQDLTLDFFFLVILVLPQLELIFPTISEAYLKILIECTIGNKETRKCVSHCVERRKRTKNIFEWQ